MIDLCQKVFSGPFWGRAFRPFFMLATIHAVFTIPIWGFSFAGYITSPVFLDSPLYWHAYEMVYGFVLAIVAGFLLTAVANWTGGAPTRQAHLALLCFLWILGRLVVYCDLGLPDVWITFLSSLFIPGLMISLAIPLVQNRNKRNFVFLGLLSILFLCQLWFLIGREMQALYIAIMVFIMMISLIGGRIIPAFTVAALRRQGLMVSQTDQSKMDILCLVSLLVTAFLMAIPTAFYLCGLFSALSAFLHLWRVQYYFPRQAFSDPMLWILHLGYFWLVIGLGLFSASCFGFLQPSSVLHALTTGAIGSLVIGMMSRVTLGHTGRELTAHPATIVSFLFVQIAAVMRVFGPLIFPEMTIYWVNGASLCWGAGFLLYLVVYGPMLVSARPDGQDA